ncbi:hypothetical protein LYNGBM3L_22460 [Moorena producens 3L]|uniref:Uncharacterized protein n=1 Tax=Moorena producens 3L TaxID=489825 RepID=F4XMN9_9CYAN|nr:hypothetical protein LYNGBM3L_22460 [Moorena producens 3L]
MSLIIRKIAIEIQNAENPFNKGFQLYFRILSFNVYLCPPTYQLEIKLVSG